jgi:hypothetical protein
MVQPATQTLSETGKTASLVMLPIDTVGSGVWQGQGTAVSTSCEVGDAVWLLRGANVPYVLRRVGNPTRNEATERVWEMIGDAYVHGVMQGEVWKDVKDQLVDIELA